MESNCRIVHCFLNANKLRNFKYGKKAAAYKKLWEELKRRKEGYEKIKSFLSHRDDKRHIQFRIDQLTDLMNKASEHF